MVKRVFLIIVLLVAGCHGDNRVTVKPTDKVDRQSELYRDVLSAVIRLKLLEQEELYYGLRDK